MVRTRNISSALPALFSRGSLTAARLPLAALAVLAAAPAFAQTTGTIAGTITDATGAVVPNAQIQISGIATGVERQGVSDNAGLYVVPSLQPGDYRIVIQAPGFGPYNVPKVQLDVDQRVTINAQLSVAAGGQTVEVNSGAAAIVADTVTVGEVLDQRTVQELPLNGRHFLDLTTLTPGGVVAPSNGSLTSPSRGLGANSFITAGNREDSVNFQINGVNLNDNIQNQITFQPSINTTSEFKIDNSTYSAEYGRSSGSIVNVSTRSGTNSFHGEVFDYERNASFDARNFFNVKGTPQAPFHRHNFGASVGGPIFRDHIFFFGSYEGLRQIQSLNLNSAVLTAAQRATVIAVNNPTAVALLRLIPQANDSTGTRFLGLAPGPVKVDQYTLDLFDSISAKNQVHAFYAYQHDKRTEPTLQGNSIPGFGDNRDAKRQVGTLSFYHIFSPTLSNEARFGGNRLSIAFNPNVTTNPATVGIGNGVNAAIGLPQISIVPGGGNLNFGGPGGFPQGRTDNFGIFNDTLTYLRGKSTFRVGGEFRRSVNNSFANDTGSITFNTVANFTNGLADVFSITPTAVNSRVFVNAGGAFVEDTYKALSNLTLELGFRFEWNGTPTEGADRFVLFNLNDATLRRVHRPYDQNFNYEPRVGFTYDPYKTGKTVFRGAYGIMADQPATNNVTGLASNPPFATGVSYSSNISKGILPIPVATLYASAGAGGIAINSIRPNFSNAYTETYNFNLQQEFPQGVVFKAGYYGSEGKHLRVRLNLNQPINGGARPYQSISAQSLYKPGVSLANANIADTDSVGHSMYNALWISVTKNLTHGLQFSANYAWSKSRDTNSLGSQGGFALQDTYNPNSSYGLSDFDVRHRAVGQGVYDVPTFRHFHSSYDDRLFGGFRLSGVAQWQSGNPINIVNTSTYTGVQGIIHPNQLAPLVTGRTRNAAGAPVFFVAGVCTAAAPTAGCVFQNTTNSFGNTPRNSVIGPRFSTVDFSVEKNTKITERVAFQLRADFFDIANHPNFANPSGQDTSGSFGQLTSTRFQVGDAGSSRQMQLVAKIIF